MTKPSDQRERNRANDAEAPIGWRSYRPVKSAVCLLAVSALAIPALADDNLQSPPRIIDKYCIDCHDSDTSEGDVNLSTTNIDWTLKDNRELWERVLRVNDERIMPPADESQPTEAERAELATWLDKQLLKHTPIGGTLPRRLNRSVYQATIRKLFDLPDFKLPVGFPGDTKLHGFNNLGEGLVLSPPLLEAYSKVAWQIADELYPPAKVSLKKQKWEAGPEDMVLSFSAAAVHGDAIRLASRSQDIMRSCTWLSRIEIKDSGTYRISIDASKFLSDKGHPFEESMILEVYARAVAATDRSKIHDFRLLKEIKVTSAESQTTVFTADIYEDETLLFRWKNAEMTHDVPGVGKPFEELSKEDPRFLAAWQKLVFPSGNPKKPIRVALLRGRNGWDKFSKNMKDADLDLTHASADSPLGKAFLKIAANSKTSLADCLCHYYFENGPSLEIHSVTIDGPLTFVDGPKDIRRAKLQQQFAGLRKESLSNEAFARRMLENSLPKAFRRPVADETVDRYLVIATEHWSTGHSFDEGMHLLIRNILISPRFLYRSLGQGRMDDHDLATRLSYFLTGAPPDATLADLAQRKRLLPAWVLERETKRLMPKDATDVFVRDFTGQWLDIALLTEIMPDPKFGFTPDYVHMARSETEHFFAEMLRENRPMTDFIDPDFTYTSPLFAKDVYQLDLGSGKKKKDVLRRIELKRGGRVGGLLGQSAIMMATANGVDTQPVLRGVWVLENILGTPPPEPPNDIPALTPDTRGTTTPREMLAAHTKEATCAVCHKQIDPIGFALENFDPVGRWRTKWPNANKAIDASVVLADGTKIRDVVDLKRWLVANIDQFSQCVAEKLMTYAAGRAPNYAERKELADIVRANRESGNGFRDLVLALIESRTFRTR